MNLKLLEYALLSLSRQKGRHLFIFFIFTLLASTALSVFTVSGALQKEAMYSVNNLPDITIQRNTGGLRQYIDSSTAEEIIMMPGVMSAKPRVWGYYPFEYLNTNLTVIGVDVFDPDMSKTIAEITDGMNLIKLRHGGMLIGAGFSGIIKRIYNSDEFSFQSPDGEYITLKTAGIFKTDSKLLSTGTVITDSDTARKILGIPDSKAADIAVTTANTEEIPTIAEKIENLSPAYRTITKEVITASYRNMFDYRGGMFLLFFISAVLTLFMLVFDRLSGLSGGETRETAILKALGWDTGDVLKVKLYESFIVSFSAFLTAVCVSFLYVYAFHAPGLREVFTGYSHLRPGLLLPFVFDLRTVLTVFFLLVPMYTAAVIIPSWRAAAAEPGETVR